MTCLAPLLPTLCYCARELLFRSFAVREGPRAGLRWRARSASGSDRSPSRPRRVLRWSSSSTWTALGLMEARATGFQPLRGRLVGQRMTLRRTPWVVCRGSGRGGGRGRTSEPTSRPDVSSRLDPEAGTGAPLAGSVGGVRHLAQPMQRSSWSRMRSSVRMRASSCGRQLLESCLQSASLR
jgi:hypothetical protein